MSAVMRQALSSTPRELLALTTTLLEAEGYCVLPARTVVLGELADAFELIADRENAPRMLIAVAHYDLFEWRWRQAQMSGALSMALRHGWTAQLIGWRRHGSDWRCRRAGLLLQGADGSLVQHWLKAA